MQRVSYNILFNSKMFWSYDRALKYDKAQPHPIQLSSADTTAMQLQGKETDIL